MLAIINAAGCLAGGSRPDADGTSGGRAGGGGSNARVAATRVGGQAPAASWPWSEWAAWSRLLGGSQRGGLCGCDGRVWQALLGNCTRWARCEVLNYSEKIVQRPCLVQTSAQHAGQEAAPSPAGPQAPIFYSPPTRTHSAPLIAIQHPLCRPAKRAAALLPDRTLWAWMAAAPSTLLPSMAVILPQASVLAPTAPLEASSKDSSATQLAPARRKPGRPAKEKLCQVRGLLAGRNGGRGSPQATGRQPMQGASPALLPPLHRLRYAICGPTDPLSAPARCAEAAA